MRLAFLILVAILSAGASLLRPTPAYACSVGADFNPIAESDIIVAGRVTNVAVGGKGAIENFVEVRLTLEVDRYLKGSGPRTIEIRDLRSAMLLRQPQTGADYLNARATDVQWAGGSGACGTLDADPTGKYVVGGLHLRGAVPPFFEATRPLVFAWGDDATDSVVRAGIARTEQLLAAQSAPTPPPRPPATGNAGLNTSEAGALPLLLAALALLGCARVLTRATS
jgi:hypothetical protein